MVVSMHKIISGGQTGGDMGGLLAGHALGLEIGGHCPANWRTENGPDLRLRQLGLICTTSSGYPPRTRLNVVHSDGTIGFGNQGSGGMKLTSKLCDELSKIYLPMPVLGISTVYSDYIEIVQNWILTWNIQVLNVAGNREGKNPGIEQYVKLFLMEALG